MKSLYIRASLILALSGSLLSCSKDKNEETLEEKLSSYSLFVIDTNRISNVNSDGSNVKLLTQVAQGTTKSTYISDLSANPERTKIAYLVRMGDFPNYATELRVADFNGENDRAIVTLNQNDIIPGKVKFASNNTIFYHYSVGGSLRLFSVNAEGSANTQKVAHQFQDISNDGRYLATLRSDFSNPNYSRIQILDLAGDGGAGSGVFFKVINAAVSSVKISPDGKRAVALYKENAAVKVQIADISVNTLVEKTVISGVDAGYTPLFLSLAPDGDSAIITVGGISGSKTYIYSLSEASPKASFNNVNVDVTNVYAF